MKFFKLALISFVILFSIVTCIGLLFPSKIVVSRAIDVKASQDALYFYTKNLKQWKLWIASLHNSDLQDSLEAKVGNSTIKIISTKKEKITGEWIESNGDVQYMSLSILSSNNNQSVVQWQFEQNIKWYPWARFSSMINDKVIGGMMEQNLANLKSLVESK